MHVLTRSRPRLTTGPAQRSTLGSVARGSHEPSRDFPGELGQRSPPAVRVGGVLSRTTIFARRKMPYGCTDLGRPFLTSLCGRIPLLPTDGVDDEDQAGLRCWCRADGGLQQGRGARARSKITVDEFM